MMQSKDSEYKPSKNTAMVENITSAEFDALKSPRVYNSHLYPLTLPMDFFKRRCKIVFIHRNPKDVAVSFYNHHYNMKEFYHYDGTWANYLNRFYDGKS